LISFRSLIDLKPEPSQNPFERNTQTLMSSSYNDNTISYVLSAEGSGRVANPPLGQSGSGLSTLWPTPSTCAGASMLSRSRKTAPATPPIPVISPPHVPSDASYPGQAGVILGPSTEVGED